MKRFLLLLALVPSLAWAGDQDDWGAWLELGTEKALPYNMEVGLEGGLRTMDGSSAMDRWDIGASLGYKAHKYLKLSAGYSFIMDNNKAKTSKEMYDEDGVLESYRHTPSFWSPRHRFYLDASTGMKFRKWLRVSARVRYQYTYKPESEVTRTDYERNDMFTPDGIVTTWDEESKVKTFTSENRQVLRTRLKLEVDKKHLDWKPFVSVEFHNNLAASMHFDKLRTCVGTGYKINKHNNVGIAYVMTLNRMEQPSKNFHAISASYSIDF